MAEVPEAFSPESLAENSEPLGLMLANNTLESPFDMRLMAMAIPASAIGEVLQDEYQASMELTGSKPEELEVLGSIMDLAEKAGYDIKATAVVAGAALLHYGAVNAVETYRAKKAIETDDLTAKTKIGKVRKLATGLVAAAAGYKLGSQVDNFSALTVGMGLAVPGIVAKAATVRVKDNFVNRSLQK